MENLRQEKVWMVRASDVDWMEVENTIKSEHMLWLEEKIISLKETTKSKEKARVCEYHGEVGKARAGPDR